MQRPIPEWMQADDPLCDDAIRALLAYREEDGYVDYKESFEPKSEKAWLSIAIDITSMANSHGGYLVYGVRDTDFRVIGLDAKCIAALKDPSEVLKKVNRHFMPLVTKLRAKVFREGEADVVILCVPESVGKTHVVSAEGVYRLPSGERKTLLHMGVVYYRASGQNRRLDPDGLQMIVDKRLKQYEDRLHANFGQIMEVSRKGYVVVPPSTGRRMEGAQPIVISDDPSALPVQGVNFRVAPESDEDLIASWLATSKKDKHTLPDERQLWGIYSRRQELRLDQYWLQMFIVICMLRQVPVFFFLHSLVAPDVKQVLLEVLRRAKSPTILGYAVRTSAFLGSRFYGSVLKKLGDKLTKLSQDVQRFPSCGPRSLFRPQAIEVKRHTLKIANEPQFRISLETRLTEIAHVLSEKGRNVKEASEACAIDCYLYARDDKYAAE